MDLSKLGGGGIKPVQRGAVASSTGEVINVTISPVDISKSFVVSSAKTSIAGAASAALQLTSGTNLRVAFSPPAGGGSITVEWQVVEYE